MVQLRPLLGILVLIIAVNAAIEQVQGTVTLSPPSLPSPPPPPPPTAEAHVEEKLDTAGKPSNTLTKPVAKEDKAVVKKIQPESAEKPAKTTSEVEVDKHLPESTTNMEPLSQASMEQSLISVCVPCIPRDVKYLPRMVKSIKAQSLQPSEVIISVSSFSTEKANDLEKELTSILPTVRVIGNANKLSPMESRMAAFRASSGHIISFMDADDEMHPQKLEIVTSIMREEKSACVLHSLAFSPDTVTKLRFDWHKAHLRRGEAIYTETVKADGQKEVSTLSIRPKGLDFGPKRSVAQGHPTVLRDMIAGILPTTLTRGEDCYFLRTLLQKLGPHDNSMTYVDLPLTIYYPSDHPDNAWTRRLKPKSLIQGKPVKSFLEPELDPEADLSSKDCECKIPVRESKYPPESVVARIETPSTETQSINP